MQRKHAHACGGALFAAAVATVRPAPARLVGLGVHHVVHDLLSESAKQLLHDYGAVVEPGYDEHVRRRV